MKLCIIYNFSQKYREGIYKLLDREYDCSWFFGNNDTDIKGIDNSILNHVSEIKNINIVGPLYYQKGVIPLFFKYDRFLMLGELFCISTWILLFLCMCSPKKKLYLWSHGWYGREGLIKRILKKMYFGMSEKTFLYGNYAKETGLKFGYKKNNLCVVHNSLNYSHQLELRNSINPSNIYIDHFGNSNPVLIFIGRLTPIKKLDLLIDALEKLKEQGESYNLVFVGDGTESARLKQLVSDKGLNSQVWFWGACYEETINAELIYNADLCVAPGNVGLTAMHTMVYGTPVATHNDFKMQMPEFEAIKDGETGCFFKYNDADSIVQSIKQWFSTRKDAREEIRQNCFKMIDTQWNPEFQIKIFKDNIQ